MPAAWNILEHPIAFRQPRRLTDVRSWHLHIPFAFLLMDLHRPRTLVELGTHRGDSYCAFCQAVDELDLETTCTAIDHWKGDEHTGRYGEGVYAELCRYHDPLYGRFSRLLRSTFDDAVAGFEDASIDLLHLDGHHAYESIRHDFETWRSKLSKRAIVLLHDTGVRQPGFGAWKVWEELSSEFSGVEFPYGHGLGVLAVGKALGDSLSRFLARIRANGEQCHELLARLGIASLYLGARSKTVADVQDDIDAAVTAWARLPGAQEAIEQHARTIRGLRDEAQRQSEALHEQRKLMQLEAEQSEKMIRDLRAEAQRQSEALREQRKLLQLEAEQREKMIRGLREEAQRQSETFQSQLKLVRQEAEERRLRDTAENDAARARDVEELRTQHSSEIELLERRVSASDETVQGLRSSLSWRMTGPLRFAARPLIGVVHMARGWWRQRLLRQEHLRTPSLHRRTGEKPASSALQETPLTVHPDSDISVIIPTMNAGKNFVRLLSVLRNQEGVARIDVVVVDSGSTDGTPEVARDSGAKVLAISPEQFSHSFARNLGADNSGGHYLFFTVQDAMPPSTRFLHDLISELKGTDAAAVSCSEFPREDSDLFYDILLWNHYRFLGVDRSDRVRSLPGSADHISLRRNGQISNIAALIPRQLFMRYHFCRDYAEDLDLGLRLIRDGHKLALLESPRIIHSHNRPPYYFLKRCYVDTLHLADLFDDFPMPEVKEHALFDDILMAYQSVSSILDFDPPLEDGPARATDVLSHFDNMLRSGNHIDRGAIEHAISRCPDERLAAFLVKVTMLCDDQGGITSPHNSMLKDALAHFMLFVKEFMSSAYPLVDGAVLKDLKSCILKGYAMQCGVHLASSSRNSGNSTHDLFSDLHQGI